MNWIICFSDVKIFNINEWLLISEVDFTWTVGQFRNFLLFGYDVDFTGFEMYVPTNDNGQQEEMSLLDDDVLELVGVGPTTVINIGI